MTRHAHDRYATATEAAPVRTIGERERKALRALIRLAIKSEMRKAEQRAEAERKSA